MAIDQRDLETTLNYIASRVGHGSVRVVLRPGAAWLQGTVEVPRSPIGRYVNIDAALHETGALPRFDHLKIGSVPVPGVLADYLLREGLRRAVETDRGGLAADVVKGVSVGDGQLRVTYRWSDAVTERARAVLVAPEDQARLRVYHDRLVEVVAQTPSKVSLATLMPAAVPPRARSRGERRHRARDARRDRRARVLLEREGTRRDRIGGKAMAAAGTAHGDARRPRRFPEALPRFPRPSRPMPERRLPMRSASTRKSTIPAAAAGFRSTTSAPIAPARVSAKWRRSRPSARASSRARSQPA